MHYKQAIFGDRESIVDCRCSHHRHDRGHSDIAEPGHEGLAIAWGSLVLSVII